MRHRAPAVAAVAAFAMAVTGVVVVARSGGGSGLERLPLATGGSEGVETGMWSTAPTGPVEYVVPDVLPDLPDEAPAFRLDDDGADKAAARVARALGVGTADVKVRQGGELPWYVLLAGPDEPVAGHAATGAPPADLPTKDEAERIARDAFARLGVGTEGFELFDRRHTWEAVVSPTAGGLPIRRYEQHLSIGSKGAAIGGHGYLGKPDRIGDYPLVGLQAGIDRLRTGLRVGPRPAGEIGVAPAQQTVIVTGARLVLVRVGDVVVPAYEFLTKEGGALTVPAVIDRWLAEHEPSTPEPAAPSKRRLGIGRSCSANQGPPRDVQVDNRPLLLNVCVNPHEAKVGEEVVFEVEVTASDEDSQIIQEGCGAPTVTFGDEREPVVRTDCAVSCTAPAEKGSPGRLERTFRHRYTGPGTYHASVKFRSGPCTTGSSTGVGGMQVFVFK